MFQIDLNSRKAIYEQVVDNFKRLIITGVMREDERVPSVRELASGLTVNPNTVQKAYRELETQGYIYTVIGQGSFIASPPEQGAKSVVLYERLREILYELKYNGEDKTRVIKFVTDALG
jgi:GntR family transcriptional regulator